MCGRGRKGGGGWMKPPSLARVERMRMEDHITFVPLTPLFIRRSRSEEGSFWDFSVNS